MPGKAWVLVVTVRGNPVMAPGTVETRRSMSCFFVFLCFEKIVFVQLREPLPVLLLVRFAFEYLC